MASAPDVILDSAEAGGALTKVSGGRDNPFCAAEVVARLRAGNTVSCSEADSVLAWA